MDGFLDQNEYVDWLNRMLQGTPLFPAGTVFATLPVELQTSYTATAAGSLNGQIDLTGAAPGPQTPEQQAKFQAFCDSTSALLNALLSTATAVPVTTVSTVGPIPSTNPPTLPVATAGPNLINPPILPVDTVGPALTATPIATVGPALTAAPIATVGPALTAAPVLTAAPTLPQSAVPPALPESTANPALGTIPPAMVAPVAPTSPPSATATLSTMECQAYLSSADATPDTLLTQEEFVGYLNILSGAYGGRTFDSLPVVLQNAFTTYATVPTVPTPAVPIAAGNEANLQNLCTAVSVGVQIDLAAREQTTVIPTGGGTNGNIFNHNSIGAGTHSPQQPNITTNGETSQEPTIHRPTDTSTNLLTIHSAFKIALQSSMASPTVFTAAPGNTSTATPGLAATAAPGLIAAPGNTATATPGITAAPANPATAAPGITAAPGLPVAPILTPAPGARRLETGLQQQQEISQQETSPNLRRRRRAQVMLTAPPLANDANAGIPAAPLTTSPGVAVTITPGVATMAAPGLTRTVAPSAAVTLSIMECQAYLSSADATPDTLLTQEEFVGFLNTLSGAYGGRTFDSLPVELQNAFAAYATVSTIPTPAIQIAAENEGNLQNLCAAVSAGVQNDLTAREQTAAISMPPIVASPGSSTGLPANATVDPATSASTAAPTSAATLPEVIKLQLENSYKLFVQSFVPTILANTNSLVASTSAPTPTSEVAVSLTATPSVSSATPGVSSAAPGVAASPGLATATPGMSTASTGLTTGPVVLTGAPGITASPGLTPAPDMSTASPGLTAAPGVLTVAPGAIASPVLTTPAPGMSTVSPGLTPAPDMSTAAPGITAFPGLITAAPGMSVALPGLTPAPFARRLTERAREGANYLQRRAQVATAAPGFLATAAPGFPAATAFPKFPATLTPGFPATTTPGFPAIAAPDAPVTAAPDAASPGNLVTTAPMSTFATSTFSPTVEATLASFTELVPDSVQLLNFVESDCTGTGQTPPPETIPSQSCMIIYMAYDIMVAPGSDKLALYDNLVGTTQERIANGEYQNSLNPAVAAQLFSIVGVVSPVDPNPVIAPVSPTEAPTQDEEESDDGGDGSGGFSVGVGAAIGGISVVVCCLGGYFAYKKGYLDSFMGGDDDETESKKSGPAALNTADDDDDTRASS